MGGIHSLLQAENERKGARGAIQDLSSIKMKKPEQVWHVEFLLEDNPDRTGPTAEVCFSKSQIREQFRKAFSNFDAGLKVVDFNLILLKKHGKEENS